MEDDGMTDIVIYEGPDGTVEVRLDRETVWLRQQDKWGRREPFFINSAPLMLEEIGLRPEWHLLKQL